MTMKHLSRWHSVTAGTATAALAAGAFGLSSMLTGPGSPPAPIVLSAAERSGDAVDDDASDDAGPRVEVQPDQRIAPTPDVSPSPASFDSPSPASPSPASFDSPSPDSPSPASVDSPSPASVDSPDEVVQRSTASTTPTVVQDSPSDSPASVSAASASADSVSASTSVDSAS
jgi:hypothetical protein